MPEDNIKAEIGGLEQNVAMPNRYGIGGTTTVGGFLSIQLDKGQNPDAQWAFRENEARIPPDTILDPLSQVAYTENPLPIELAGTPVYLPLKLTNANPDRPTISTSQTVEDKINRYYNDAIIQYDDNGTSKSFHLYAPDDVASLLLDNYAPPGQTFNDPPELEQFLQKYQTMLQDETLEKRMSHYNQNWEENNQTILDALNNQNGLEMQQILWDVYDFT